MGIEFDFKDSSLFRDVSLSINRLRSAVDLIKMTNLKDRERLYKLIELVERLDSRNYTKLTWKKLMTVYGYSKVMYDDNVAAKEEMYEKSKELEKSINSLKDLTLNSIWDISAPTEAGSFDIINVDLYLGNKVDKVRVTYFWNENDVKKKYDKYYVVEISGKLSINIKFKFAREYKIEFTPIVDGKVQIEESELIYLEIRNTESNIIRSVTGNGDINSTTINRVGESVIFKIETSLGIDRIRLLFTTSNNYFEYYSRSTYAKEIDGKLIWIIEKALRTVADSHKLIISTLNGLNSKDTVNFEVNINQFLNKY